MNNNIIIKGMASIFPTGITWAERYMEVTGKATAVFVVGSALGEMFMPAFTGFLFEAKEPMWLLYIMLGGALIADIVYIIMQNLASNSGTRRRYTKIGAYRPTGTATGFTDDEDGDELEMDSVPLSIDDDQPLISRRRQRRNRKLDFDTTSGKRRVTFDLTDDAKALLGNRSPPKAKSPRSILKTARDEVSEVV